MRLQLALGVSALALVAAQWNAKTLGPKDRQPYTDRETAHALRYPEYKEAKDNNTALQGNRTIRSVRPVVWPCSICECNTNEELELKYGKGFGISTGELKMHLRPGWENCQGKECDSPLICLMYEEMNGQRIPDARNDHTFCVRAFTQDAKDVNDHAENVEGRKAFCGVNSPCQTSCVNNKTVDPTDPLAYYIPGQRLERKWEKEDFAEMTQRYLRDVANRNALTAKWFEKQDEDPAGLNKFRKDVRKLPPYVTPEPGTAPDWQPSAASMLELESSLLEDE